MCIGFLGVFWNLRHSVLDQIGYMHKHSVLFQGLCTLMVMPFSTFILRPDLIDFFLLLWLKCAKLLPGWVIKINNNLTSR